MPGDLAGRCAIVGTGQTPYTRGTDRSTLQLQLDAAERAIADAGLTPADIDAVMPNAMSERIAEDFIVELGLPDVAYTSTHHTGGASVLSAVQSACLAVAAGVSRHALVVAGRRGYSAQRVSTSQARPERVTATVGEFEKPYGAIVAAQWFAQSAQRHMHLYGTTEEQLGHVAVGCRRHANLNPRAYMHGRGMTLEDHRRSRMITTPFRLFDCSLETDGAAAVVITSVERAADLPHRPVLVRGIAEGHGDPPTSITQKHDITVLDGLRSAGRRAFRMAGLRPADIDCAQLYDAFTWFVIASLEALGFCGPGEGGPFVEDGRIGPGGALPVNTHGGLLSEAHVSGMNHLVEAVHQLRGTAEPQRLVPGCEHALVSNEGDFFEGSVAILERGGR
ncbi:thiolase C-terminal domain-containing protein [Tomitella gaofuii]|uniref:thiolase C-terminal domain-containing protein n=1 Tax=Tomitella gaofuii TaxID=2760083 RepID=UPI0015FD2123|nr:transporter [Tomitella gaofuii]